MLGHCLRRWAAIETLLGDQSVESRKGGIITLGQHKLATRRIQ